MMDTRNYVLVLLAALVAGTVLYAVCLKKHGLKASISLIALPLSGLFAYCLATGFYNILQMNVRLSVYRYSFMGGVAGLLLGVILSALVTKTAVSKSLDAYAPALALQIAVARLGEYFMGDVGLGHYTETAWMCRFPFAMVNEWQEWYEAVFMLEAVTAIIVTVLALVLLCKKQPDGLLLERVLYMLCVPQVLCEQLRTMTMSWGFVRVEQVLCAVILLALMVRNCYKNQVAEKARVTSAWWPAAVTVLMIGIVTAMEFAIDGKIQLPLPLVWTLFIGALVVLLVVYQMVVKKRNKLSA